MAKFCDVDREGGRSVFPRAHAPFFRAAEVRKYDTLSLQDRLMAMKFAPDIHHLVAPQLAINCHRDPASAALVDQLTSWSLGDFDLGRLFDRLVKYKIEQGASALAYAIIADGGTDVMLSTPVACVEQGGATVTATPCRVIPIQVLPLPAKPLFLMGFFALRLRRSAICVA